MSADGRWEEQRGCEPNDADVDVRLNRGSLSKGVVLQFANVGVPGKPNVDGRLAARLPQRSRRSGHHKCAERLQRSLTGKTDRAASGPSLALRSHRKLNLSTAKSTLLTAHSAERSSAFAAKRTPQTCNQRSATVPIADICDWSTRCFSC